MERIGHFECSDHLVNRLHENVVWSMRGNFLDIPTDCPQRDERLGWTGDTQVFTPTATFLYDCVGLLRSWLKDLAVEQHPDGTVPWYVPYISTTSQWTPPRPSAVWGDAAVLVPAGLFAASADREILAAQYVSARRWVDLVDRLAGDTHVWDSGFQLGDWLDPAAPPDAPAASTTDPSLVATAYFARSARQLARMAAVLHHAEDVERYERLAAQVTSAFQSRFVGDDGRLTSDTQTAYALAICFELLPDAWRAAAGDRLAELVAEAGNHIATGFAGTPLVTEALTQVGHTDEAYALLLERTCPSWLYAVTRGATTVWERWDSLLPDGRVNAGEMTSFNHMAFGAVASWLHRRVAGLEPAMPGYRTIAFRPCPGGGLTHASASHQTPYGLAAIHWRRDRDGVLEVTVTVPTGTAGIVELPGEPPVEVGSGRHRFSTRLPSPDLR
jgi:alpha-L-rhamnosidase